MTSPIRSGAAMVLLFDVAADAIEEHDHWHTHEHMPERLRIPGFVRGTRWTARDAPGRYCVVYEVAALAVLDSPAYRERLDHPTPWTAAMMRKYAGMRRALCTVHASSGCGTGGTALVIRFAPAPQRQEELDRWLARDVLPDLAQRPGLAGARLYRRALTATATREQDIRGRDATVHSALLVTGYDGAAVAALAGDELEPRRFTARGASEAEYGAGLYRQAFTLTAAEVSQGS